MGRLNGKRQTVKFIYNIQASGENPGIIPNKTYSSNDTKSQEYIGEPPNKWMEDCCEQWSGDMIFIQDCLSLSWFFEPILCWKFIFLFVFKKSASLIKIPTNYFQRKRRIEKGRWGFMSIQCSFIWQHSWLFISCNKSFTFECFVCIILSFFSLFDHDWPRKQESFH